MKKIFIFNELKFVANYLNAIKKTSTNFIVSTDVNDCKDCTHLLLCGGGDISPCLYGEINYSCNEIDQIRDLKELWLIDYFYKRDLPILGVCRGMQIISVAFGGKIEQTIKDKRMHKLNEQDQFHFIENYYGFIQKIYGNNLLVNSAHQQRIGKVPLNFLPCSYSDDGTLEAFMHKNGKILGVQFHPERMGNLGQKIYDYFVNLS